MKNQKSKFTKASIFGLVVALLSIGFTTYFAYIIIPQQILANTDQEVAKRDKSKSESESKSREKSLSSLIEKENQEIKFTDQKVKLEIGEFGSINISLKDKVTPLTTENFLRLVNRGYYNDTIFHRMVEGPAFNIIQGGGPKGNPQGGETANGKPLVDEIWDVKPEYKIDENDPNNESKLVNTPKFKDAGLYPAYSVNTGLATFPKGLVLMANTGAPDSGTSQFFVTLDQTVLAPSYTVFGVIDDEESMKVLTKIKDEVDPVPSSTAQTETLDGTPNKEIKLKNASIIKN
jgi:cyclophilin family peptidyl-prolyl cis-trans isomerase